MNGPRLFSLFVDVQGMFGETQHASSAATKLKAQKQRQPKVKPKTEHKKSQKEQPNAIEEWPAAIVLDLRTSEGRPGRHSTNANQNRSHWTANREQTKTKGDGGHEQPDMISEYLSQSVEQ